MMVQTARTTSGHHLGVLLCHDLPNLRSVELPGCPRVPVLSSVHVRLGYLQRETLLPTSPPSNTHTTAYCNILSRPLTGHARSLLAAVSLLWVITCPWLALQGQATGHDTAVGHTRCYSPSQCHNLGSSADRFCYLDS